MTLIFQGSAQPTLGVEIELQILDPETLNLNPVSEKLRDECQKQGLERIKAEVHQSMLEIDTEISNDVKECHHYLKTRLSDLTQVANSLGTEISIAGTHPFQRWADGLITNEKRYRMLYQKFQWLVRRMNVYGLHVHVGVPSGEHAITVSRAMIRYFPHLLALSANSPFWQGVDTGMQSSRVNIMESFPYAGIPPLFNSWGEFEHYYHTLHKTHAIRSLKDLYWFIRPNLTFGTIEFRICDAMSSLTETMSLVALSQCLVVNILEKDKDHPLLQWTNEENWIATENQWIAARDGLDGNIIVGKDGKREKISDSIYKLVEELAPIAKRLNCAEELEQVKDIIKDGNGAQRQRLTYQVSDSLKEVVSYATREFKESLQTETVIA